MVAGFGIFKLSPRPLGDNSSSVSSQAPRGGLFSPAGAAIALIIALAALDRRRRRQVSNERSECETLRRAEEGEAVIASTVFGLPTLEQE